eukprot:CAMPEP_0183764932 /NCGR_PEP_ID=MMETSP0739-20130205/10608_1 /TAXON_ID=385413 /ORGANISM="Thalassiosira miniscula, Strain CCMP1093" /LENGTH=429 /DNA_ID=CAMNT_0026003531 /DNA_START=332 /DNA_END=1621 /DNA_ORIENTATION=+
MAPRRKSQDSLDDSTSSGRTRRKFTSLVRKLPDKDITRRKSQDSLDDSMSSSRHSSYLLGLVVEDKPEQTLQPSEKGGSIPRAISMLEMNDIQDMLHFGDAMDALTLKESSKSKNIPVSADNPAGSTTSDEDEGAFFIGDDDHRDLALSSSPDSVFDIPQEFNPAPSKKGMRRVMSTASLSTPKFSLSSMVAQQDIHTISEEGDADVSSKTQNKIDKKSIVPSEKKVDEATTTSSTTPSTTIAALANHTLRRPSRRASPCGMPLRSSLKGSSNNLRGSGTSQSSIASGQSAESSKSNNMKRNVSFSSLEIRSYNVTLGDAPTSNGPAVSLDWEYDPSATASYCIDKYEEFRTDEAPRRSKQEMIMPPMHRQYLLMREAGFTRSQIQQAMEEAKRVARGRQKTVRNVRLGITPVEEKLEKAKRKIFGKKR